MYIKVSTYSIASSIEEEVPVEIIINFIDACKKTKKKLYSARGYKNDIEKKIFFLENNNLDLS